jgi:glycosyltransferase involved in cell wall biosynthesis
MQVSARSTQAPGRRARVVTLIDFVTDRGGAERFALQVASGLDPRRFESILCASRWPLAPELERAIPSARALAELERSGARFFPLRRRHKVDPAAWMRFERFLRRERVDVLHTHKFGSNLWGALVAGMARVPVVVAHEHTWSYQGQPLRRFLDREVIARRADRFLAVSRADRRRMTEVEGIDAARTGFIPIGIHPSTLSAGARDVRAELGLRPDAPVIGSVGILRPQKANEVLIRAVALLAAKRPDVRLLLVGDGPARASLERLVGELDLRENVKLLGMRSDVPEILRALDVAACSSDFEGSPLAVMEYMDMGLPIAATAVGGIPDLIESGVHGLLVPPRDPGALAGALEELLGDRARARAMGECASERRRAEFDLGVVIARIEALYCELLARRGIAVPVG